METKGHLISRSQTIQTRRVCSLAPEQLVIADVVQRRDRKDQDIIPHVPPGLDGISLVSRSISRRRRTGDQIYERACYT
ncbi:unnamed protein product [Hymenolepis diminuta]|uniref:Uncharacterized protein n=1 Tax=Hymenolepis diminuta TaxID=6216 RepID=A0A564Z203_HYMDI|nr:unnamed protein product [Hymenolepis diminuta]